MHQYGHAIPHSSISWPDYIQAHLEAECGIVHLYASVANPEVGLLRIKIAPQFGEKSRKIDFGTFFSFSKHLNGDLGIQGKSNIWLLDPQI